MKTCPVGAELFHPDGRRERKKLTVAFSLNTLSTKPKIINNPNNDIIFLKHVFEGHVST